MGITLGQLKQMYLNNDISSLEDVDTYLLNSATNNLTNARLILLDGTIIHFSKYPYKLDSVNEIAKNNPFASKMTQDEYNHILNTYNDHTYTIKNLDVERYELLNSSGECKAIRHYESGVLGNRESFLQNNTFKTLKDTPIFFRKMKGIILPMYVTYRGEIRTIHSDVFINMIYTLIDNVGCSSKINREMFSILSSDMLFSYTYDYYRLSGDKIIMWNTLAHPRIDRGHWFNDRYAYNKNDTLLRMKLDYESRGVVDENPKGSRG